MSSTQIVAGIFAVLLGLEWKFGRTSLRVGVALLSLVVLFLFQPNYTNARRAALGTTASERVTRSPVSGKTLPDYQSGVETAIQALEATNDEGPRFVATIALFWLACSPARPRAPRAVDAQRPFAPGSRAPEA